MLLGGPLVEIAINCEVSRDEGTGKTGPRSGLAISHCEVSLIKGNGLSGNFESVFAVVFSVHLGDSNSTTVGETIKASSRMFSLPLCPLLSPRDCTSKLSTEFKSCFIVWLLKAVVRF